MKVPGGIRSGIKSSTGYGLVVQQGDYRVKRRRFSCRKEAVASRSIPCKRQPLHWLTIMAYSTWQRWCLPAT
jgi:hypothetical protein